jgi:hypothetical protein
MISIRRFLRPARTLVLLLAFPGGLKGQAICSAPHSSPTLAHSGSLQTLPPGAGWIQASAFGQRASSFFGPSGNRQSFLADSEFDTRSLFLTGAFGLHPGIEIWAQVPVHRLEVKTTGGTTRESGLGDLRLAIRLGSALLGSDLPLSLRLGAKFPGSEFPVDATVLPLTEGQRDWELSLESGINLPGTSSFVMGWVGYRWRGENQEAARHPADELFASVALGGELGPWAWGLGADALWGGVPVAQGFRLPGDKRRLYQILPSLGIDAGPGRLETSGQIPLSGQNLPVGVGVSLGYRFTWGLEPPPADLRDYFQG